MFTLFILCLVLFKDTSPIDIARSSKTCNGITCFAGDHVLKLIHKFVSELRIPNNYLSLVRSSFVGPKMSTSLLQLARRSLVSYTKSSALILQSSFKLQQRSLSSFAIKGVHEPEYLDYLKPQIPYYNAINIQVCSFA